ncbi:hypothetical protein E2C01_017936 [Portunus trituberculatus]|uniref:Uncharacterized protein n=1 Tax=Portunus trituberculatus TaxID=210409 RepID=A0A5B7DT68_PORTR|nr:hypothetical protein [Portunus trituberculatus]
MNVAFVLLKEEKKNYQELQTQLHNLVLDLNEGKKTIAEFLRGISHNLRGDSVKAKWVNEAVPPRDTPVMTTSPACCPFSGYWG